MKRSRAIIPIIYLASLGFGLVAFSQTKDVFEFIPSGGRTLLEKLLKNSASAKSAEEWLSSAKKDA